MNGIKIVDVNAEAVETFGFYCSKNKADEGYRKKLDWLHHRFDEGLKIKLLQDEEGRDLGFIEYVPGEFAWRPVAAEGYFFIHCIVVMKRENRETGYGSLLIKTCLADAKRAGMKGVAVVCSDGGWMANSQLFLKNGFEWVERRGRFDLLANRLREAPLPYFLDWEAKLKQYQGLHLLIAHQCPWHAKAVRDLKQTAEEAGLHLQITEIRDAESAQQSGSGFGVFALVYNGQLLADHYISSTRFRNILGKELHLT